MNIEIVSLAIPEVKAITPKVFHDARGTFQEVYRLDHYSAAGMNVTFAQDNWSRSSRNVLRGLHYQLNEPQAKLVSVVNGTVFDVAVDIRVGSPTFGQWVGETISDTNRRQLYIPAGFAHGFCVLSDYADLLYKCSSLYNPAGDRGILWNDPVLNIQWPVCNPLVSDRDAKLPTLRNAGEPNLPRYTSSDSTLGHT